MKTIALKYDSQCNPQELFLEVDENDAWIDVDCEIGNSFPSRVFHGTAIRFTLSHLDICTDDEAQGFLDCNISIIERLQASYREVWDGGNYVGEWNQEIADELQAACDSFESKWSFVEAEGYCWEERKEIGKKIKIGSIDDVWESILVEAHENKVQIYGLMSFLEELSRMPEEEESDDE